MRKSKLNMWDADMGDILLNEGEIKIFSETPEFIKIFSSITLANGSSLIINGDCEIVHNCIIEEGANLTINGDVDITYGTKINGNVTINGNTNIVHSYIIGKKANLIINKNCTLIHPGKILGNINVKNNIYSTHGFYLEGKIKCKKISVYHTRAVLIVGGKIEADKKISSYTRANIDLNTNIKFKTYSKFGYMLSKFFGLVSS